MSDVIRINSLMRKYLDDYRRKSLLYMQAHFDDDDIYQIRWEELTNMSDQDLICDALNTMICHFKYDEGIND